MVPSTILFKQLYHAFARCKRMKPNKTIKSVIAGWTMCKLVSIKLDKTPSDFFLNYLNYNSLFKRSIIVMIPSNENMIK